ncbi:conserved hypothetical protein [Deferribacter desulfuricans SSM1]|uniref:Flagellar protein FlgJ N-terminal domain-containing protein n=1 Tax=Deferribacter desulfuricans (strain DSM 14783 / JCM 11476 / NBRC 101012 / SSM1) TaxID=639282 RepID=D3PA55_DEFDS|nr:rod-binding protein [Deferribacter desulfuricans]BAI81595.1 conserved hypothetical protein [Deferribacter desulfuricans SSM1]
MNVSKVDSIAQKNMQLEKLKKACADFEALLYHEMFKSSKTNFGDGLLKKTLADDVYKDMFYMEVSKIAAERSENGVKDLLYNFLSKSIVGNDYSKYGKKLSENTFNYKDILA